MLDIETMGTKIGCQILTIACARFVPTTGIILNRFYKRIDVGDYLNYNYFVDEDTLKWWQQQDQKAIDEAFNNKPRYLLKDVFTEFVNFFPKDERIYIWSHGKEFDIPIVENVLNDLKLNIPWKFWDTRDTRTLYDVMNINLKNISIESEFMKHHALYDVELQIKGVYESYRKLQK